jgi:hypothetical protein
VFSSPEAIEALAVRVDLALHNINAEMKSVKDKYDADCKRYEEFKARPFFTRLFQSAHWQFEWILLCITSMPK